MADFILEQQLSKNQELWEITMQRLAKCKLEEQSGIINYLIELNLEHNRLLSLKESQKCY